LGIRAGDVGLGLVADRLESKVRNIRGFVGRFAGPVTVVAFIVTLGDLRSAWTAEPDAKKPAPLVVDRSAPLLLDGGSQAAAKKPAPLVVDKTAPLLLDGGAGAAAKKKVADNESCYVCHGNYRTESMVQQHAVENIGCVKCHGDSFDHRGDEDNITPPDIMFSLVDIDKQCKTCHDTHDASATKVIECWQTKCPARTNPRDMVCTDCHGEHRLKFRTVWWDKKTRQLGDRKPGEKFRANPDLTKTPGQPTSATSITQPEPTEEMK
jgi:hypothetical protein